MAKVTRTLSKKVGPDGKSEVLLRLNVDRTRQYRLRSGIFVDSLDYDSEANRIRRPRSVSPRATEVRNAADLLKEMELCLCDICEDKEVTKYPAEYFQHYINDFLARNQAETAPQPKPAAAPAPKRKLQLKSEPSPKKMRFMPEFEDEEEEEEGEVVVKPEPVEPVKRKRGRPRKVVEEPVVEADTEERMPSTFFELYRRFVDTRNVSEWRRARYDVVERALYRFEGYRKIMRRNKKYELTLGEFTTQDVLDFEKFLRSEEELYVKYPQLYEKYPCDTRKVRKKAKPKAKGDNTIINLFQCLRSFFNDCMNRRIIDRHPFDDYHGKATERYGTPYYISLEERDIIANHDFSDNPYLEAQRDIFIFHTLIGCRISDLYRLTSRDIVGGAIEYIASKTLKERANTIRVPLNQRGLDLIKKYKGVDPEGRLFPFVLKQRYNDAIKKIFTICGITRMVTIINPATGLEEKRPINELASSHLARRTFVGNLYKKVKDPNIVGALSGHSEGSKAFARYRTIDDDIKRELISYLD